MENSENKLSNLIYLFYKSMNDKCVTRVIERKLCQLYDNDIFTRLCLNQGFWCSIFGLFPDMKIHDTYTFYSDFQKIWDLYCFMVKNTYPICFNDYFSTNILKLPICIIAAIKNGTRFTFY